MILAALLLVVFALACIFPSNLTVTVGGKILGFTHDHIYGNWPQNRGDVYLERWIFWLGVGTLRLHKFHRGDEESAPHDHPWWFLTFPFQTYHEVFWDEKRRDLVFRAVDRFRLHYRGAKFRHVVKLVDPVTRESSNRPAYTLVVTGDKSNKWGFWPKPDIFVYWRDWFARSGQTAAAGTIADDVDTEGGEA